MSDILLLDRVGSTLKTPFSVEVSLNRLSSSHPAQREEELGKIDPAKWLSFSPIKVDLPTFYHDKSGKFARNQLRESGLCMKETAKRGDIKPSKRQNSVRRPQNLA